MSLLDAFHIAALHIRSQASVDLPLPCVCRDLLSKYEIVLLVYDLKHHMNDNINAMMYLVRRLYWKICEHKKMYEENGLQVKWKNLMRYIY